MLNKKAYLGGPDEHGSRRCIYAIGEMRSAPLSEKEIIETYRNTNAAFGDETLPVRVLFSDQRDSPYEMPFIAWQEELENSIPADNTLYIAHITARRSALADPRCDD